jgi:prepilin-type processing-associated H-X9-DG protein
MHEGGVYTAFCDGSVHFISNSVNTSGSWGSTPAVWDKFIASCDGQTFSADALGVR